MKIICLRCGKDSKGEKPMGDIRISRRICLSCAIELRAVAARKAFEYRVARDARNLKSVRDANE